MSREPEQPLTGEEAGLRERISQRGEEAVGQFVQAVLENPAMSQALQSAFGARQRASQAQTAALGALNLPTAGDVDRLNRRIRVLSQRLEALEDGIDRLEMRLEQDQATAATATTAGPEGEAPSGELLEEIARDLAALRRQLGADPEIARDQSSLDVSA